MPYSSKWMVTIPTISLPSFLFTSPSALLSEEPLIIDAERPSTHFLSLHTYREWSKQFAAGLVAAGLRTGDRLMLFGGNSIFSPVAIMGTIMAGGIYTSGNPAFTARELAYQLKDSGASFLLAAENCVDRALDGARLAGLAPNRVFLFHDLDPRMTSKLSAHSERGATRTWTQLIASPAECRNFQWEQLDTQELANRTMVLFYSSGTTGLPKGVEASHYNIVSNIYQLNKMHNQESRNTSGYIPRGLCFLPMYHGLGLVYYSWVAPKMGLPVYMMVRFDLEKMLHHIQRYKITELLMVPPVLIAMAKYPLARSGRYDLTSVRKVVCGAAPLGMEVTVQFEKLWPDGSVRVRQAYGMSEAPCIVLAWHDEDDGESTTSVGELVPNVEAKIMNEEASGEVLQTEAGELWCRGPNVMKGYWRNVKASQETITPDGWLKTGDVACVDESGKFFTVDRKKELIKVRGAQVAPAELEAVLLEHAEVADAAVVGARIAGDENPRAYVVLRPKAKTSAEDIVEFVASRVAKVKRITGGVVFVDSIPKLPSGKILRRQLRDRAAKELNQSASVKASL